jgi:hypothetical protein
MSQVWLLWAPSLLAVWSAAKQEEWLSLMFNGSMDADDPALQEEAEPLQDAESYLLRKLGYRGPSPYMFLVSSHESE